MNWINRIGLYAGIVALFCNAHGGVEQAGVGPKAIDAFGLEKPETPEDMRTAPLNLKNPFGDFKLPADLLKPARDGRVQLFSVSRLSAEDMKNPFEVRVQVVVDMMETVFEIGGIIEAPDPAKNTVLLLVREPSVRSQDSAPSAQGSNNSKQKRTGTVCSVGDIVAGFTILAIGRDSIIIEQRERYVEVARGGPVTVCVPLSAR